MGTSKYRTAPVASTSMPKGVPFIVGNEAAERFSFYGMRAILFVFMTEYLVNRQGELDVMTEPQARSYYHLFVSSAYFFPILGALLSDIFLGKYRTIILLSLVYVAGHATLAVDDTRFGLAIGLALIALGAGGIKPCVSAHVGDQFGQSNEHLLPRVFSWFYFSINLGSFISTLLTPVLLDRFGPGVAFGVPGIFMALATLVFWMGRHRFVHIPPGGTKFVKEAFSGMGLTALLKLCLIYVFVAVFWSLYDQTGSAWVEQARSMERNIFGIELLPSQIQAINPILILTLIPIFTYGVYPALNRFFTLTPLRKVYIGFFVTVVSFLIPAWVQSRIDAGFTPAIEWQLLSYLLLTAGEVMVSITCLEFSYTQAPKTMKSFIMGVFFLSIASGNAFTSFVNYFIQNPDGTTKLDGPAYYLFFSGIMFAAALIFVFIAENYRERRYIHEEVADEEIEAEAGVTM